MGKEVFSLTEQSDTSDCDILLSLFRIATSPLTIHAGSYFFLISKHRGIFQINPI